MSNDLVSIITPSFNAERYIQESIDSVLVQTYNKFEMIIVDDCSTDSTCKIVEKYIKTDSRIKLIRLKKNMGQAIARNLAIEKSLGRYIAFLDSDDVWKKNKLEKQIEFMKKNDIAFTYSSYDIIDEKSNLIGTFDTKSRIDYQSMLKTCSVGCLTAIYDTAKLGKMYMPMILKRQDYGLWLDILKKIQYTEGMLESLALYRVRKNSVSSNKLKAAQYQWKVYREIEKLNILKSLYYFSFYAINGIIKYKKY